MRLDWWTVPDAIMSPRQQQRYGSAPESARAARRFVTEFFRQAGADPHTIAELELIVSELVTNAVEHGSGADVSVVVDASDPRSWGLNVVSHTSGDEVPELSAHSWQIASISQRSGRGLGIVRELSDDVDADWHDGRFTVGCRRSRTLPGASQS